MEYIKDAGMLEEIASRLIEGLPELNDLADVDIGFQRGLGRKKVNSQTVYADCRKVPDWLAEFVSIDYVITVYESADSLTTDGLRVLMQHELMHIRVEDGKYKLRPHDIQDFRAITDVYGPDWVDSFSRQMKLDMEGDNA